MDFKIFVSGLVKSLSLSLLLLGLTPLVSLAQALETDIALTAETEEKTAQSPDPLTAVSSEETNNPARPPDTAPQPIAVIPPVGIATDESAPPLNLEEKMNVGIATPTNFTLAQEPDNTSLSSLPDRTDIWVETTPPNTAQPTPSSFSLSSPQPLNDSASPEPDNQSNLALASTTNRAIQSLAETDLPPQTLAEAGLHQTVLTPQPVLQAEKAQQTTNINENPTTTADIEENTSDDKPTPTSEETLAAAPKTENLRVPFIVETEFRGRAGRQSGAINLRIPIWQDSNDLLFSDLHFTGAGDGTLLGNFGLAYRHVISTATDRSDAWIFGAYGFYDRKRSQHGFTYNQATFGTEVYNNRFEFRANGYLNGGDAHVIGRRQLSDVVLQPSSTGFGLDFVRRTFNLEARERALPGFDVEMGYRHPFTQDISLGLHGGYFHFDSNDTPALSGPTGRLQLEWEDAFGLPGSMFTTGATVRHDNVRGTQVAGFLRFSISLGRNRPKQDDPFDGVTRLARRPIERNYEITTLAQDITRDVSIEELVAAANGSSTLSQSGPQLESMTELGTCVPPLETPNNACRLFFVDGDGTNGTGLQNNPLTVAQATNVAITSAGDILFLLDDAGKIDTAPGTGNSFTLQDNQQLLGVGNATSRLVMNVPGINTDLTVTDSGRPMLFNSAATGDVITLANNNNLDGFGIAGMMMGRDGIAGTGGTGGTINDVMIEQTGRDGIHLENWNGITITDTTITDATQHGVFLSNVSGTIDFTGNNTINHGKAVATGDAFHVDSSNATINYNGNIANTTNNAVNRLLAIRNTTGGSVAFSGGTLSQTDGDGILIENAAGTTTIDSTINITGGAGIDIQGGAGNVTVNGSTTVANTVGTALNVENRTGGTVQFDTVALNNSGGIGINLNNNAGAFSVTGTTTVDGATGVSVDINGGTGGVSFAGINIDNRGDVGIDVNAGNQVINFGAVGINNQNSSTATALNIQDTTGGSVTATSTTINNNNANAEGVTLVNNAATVNLGGGSITGAANTAFRVTQGAANVNYAGSITNTAGRTVDIQNRTGGTIAFSGAISDSGGGQGIRIDSNTGTNIINFTGNVDLGIPANRLTGGTALTFTGNSATTTATFSNLDIATDSQIGIDATAAGTLNVTTGTLDTTGAGATAARLNGITAGMNFSSVTVDNIGAANDALDFTNVAGSFAVTGNTNIGPTGAVGSGIDINGGTANYSFAGTTIANSNTAGIDVNGTTGGSVAFNNTVNINGSNAQGINLTNNTADFTVSGTTTIDGAGGSSIDINGTGNATFAGVTITNRSADGIDIDGTSGTLQFGATSISGAGGVTAGIDVNGSTGGSTTFNSTVNVTGSGGQGINLTNNTGSFTVSGATTIDGATGVSVDVNGGTGGVSLAGVNVERRGNVGIDVNAGNQTINFGAVSINNQNSSTTTALNIQDTTGGSVTATSTTIDNNNAVAEGVTLVNNAAPINLGTGSIIGAGNTAFRVTQGLADVAYAGSITNTAGRSVQVENSGGTPANTINLTGAINDIGQGIFLNNNDQNAGATVNFSGGLTLSTGANAAFTATNGGTVNVTGTNTVTTTTGTGVNIANTMIGSSNVTFQNVSVTGAANGIIVDNAGSTGSFIVTGVTTKPDGGTIRTTAEGVRIVNSNASLSRMDISSAGSHGVEILRSLAGTSTVTLSGNTIGSTSGGAANDGLNAQTTLAGAMLDLTVNDNMFSSTNGDGADINGAGGGTLTIAGFSGNMVTSTGGNGLSVNTATFDANTITPGIQQVNAGNTQIGTGAIGGNALNLMNVAGSVLFDTGSAIANNTGIAVNVEGGDPDIAYNGTITNGTGRMVRVANTTGGTVSFGGTLTHTTGTGIQLDGANGNVTFSNALTIANSTADGIEITGGGTGTYTFADLNINNSALRGLDLLDSDGTIQINGNLSIDGTAAGANHEGLFASNATTGTLNVTGTFNVDNTGDTAVYFNGSNMNVNVTGAGTIRGVGVNAFLADNTATGNYLLNNVVAVAEAGIGADDTTSTSKLARCGAFATDQICLSDALGIWFIDATTNGVGTFADPASVATVVANSGANDVIYLRSNNGTIDATAASLTLKDNQLLFSSDNTLQQVAGRINGTANVFSFTPTDAALATIQANNNVDVIQLANDNELNNFTIQHTGAGTGRGIFGTGINNLTASGLTIQNTAGAGVQLNNATGAINFNGTNTVSNTGGVGVDIVGSGGTFTFANTAITNSAGAGLNVNGGAAAVNYNGTSSIAQANNASAVNVQGGHTGIITFANTTNINATNGDGLQFNNADGTYNFNGAVTLNGGDAGIDILNGSGGTFTFANTTVTSPTGIGLNVDGGAANVNYNGMSSITQANNASAVNVQGGHSGTITFANTSNIGATNGDGLQFNNADGTYNFNGTTTLNGGDAGIDILNGSGGGFTFSANTSITDPSGTAFNLNASAPTVTYNGTISQNNAARIVEMDDLQTGGSVNFTGAVTATGGTGVSIINSEGDVTFADLNLGINTAETVVSRLMSDALTLTTNTGTYNFTNADIYTNGGRGIVATNSGTLNITDMLIDTQQALGIDIQGTAMTGPTMGAFFSSVTVNNTTGTGGVSLQTNTGTTTLQDVSITNTGGTGLLATNAGTLNVARTLATNNNISTTTGTAIDIQDTTIGSKDIAFNNVTSTNAAADGINISNLDSGTFSITGTTTISGSGANGIDIIGGSSAAFTFANAIVDNTAGAGINLNGANGAVTFTTVDIDGTTGAGIAVTDNTNAVNINGGTIGATTDAGNAANAAVDINNGSGNVTVAAAITNNTAGEAVEITGRTGGAVTISGALNHTAGGAIGIDVNNNTGGSSTFNNTTQTINSGTAAAISLATNTGHTINFTGGNLNVDTTSGTGFAASGGGTINVTGANNNIDSTTGTALNLDGITIGGSNMTFATVDKNNAAGANVGIRLNNVNGGTFNVTGSSTIAGTAGANINGIEVTGGTSSDVTFASVTIDGTSGHGIHSNGTTGTVNINGGTIGATTTTTGDAVNIDGGTGNVTVAAAITNSSQNSVDVQNRTGGIVNIDGTINDTGTGIFVNGNSGGADINFTGSTKSFNTGANAAVNLTSNTGATIDFTGGGLTIATTTGTGFNATGGGTITVQGAGNTISTTGAAAAALNIANTTIGAANVTFESISANGTTNGIVLNTTGTSGGLIVTGDAGSTQNASGGTIQNTTGDGISLTSTSNVQFDQIALNNIGRHGIFGNGVNNLQVTNSTFNNVGNANDENVFEFRAGTGSGAAAITGTLTITNINVTNFHDTGVLVYNESGSLTIDIDNANFDDNDDTDGVNAIFVETAGTASLAMDVNGGVFNNLEGDVVVLQAGGSGSQDVNILNTRSTNGGGPDNFPNGGGLQIGVLNGATLTFDIQGNTITDMTGPALNVFTGAGNGNLEGRIGGPNAADGNTFSGDSRMDSDGILMSLDGFNAADPAGNYTILIQNNDIGVDNTGGGFNGLGDDGIQILHRDNSGTLNLTIEDNTIANTASEAIRLFSDEDLGIGANNPTNNIRIVNNNFTNIGTANDIELRTSDTARACYHIFGNDNGGGGAFGTINFNVAGSSSAEITQASLAALSSDNNSTPTNVSSGSVSFNATCTNPTLPSNP